MQTHKAPLHHSSNYHDRKTLDKFHKLGYVHGDIRVANLIFCNDSMTAHIIDYDLTTKVGKKYPNDYNIEFSYNSSNRVRPLSTPTINLSFLPCIIGRTISTMASGFPNYQFLHHPRGSLGLDLLAAAANQHIIPKPVAPHPSHSLRHSWHLDITPNRNFSH